MKAILLSAGYGTRLMPLTKKKPKCLMKIKKKVLLDFWIEKLLKIGIKDILINLHYKRDKVVKHISKSKYKKFLTTTIEKKILGTAKTLTSNYNFYKSSEVMLIHSDNYCLDNLKKFISSHKKRPKNCLLTMMTFETESPENCGILKISKKGVVKKIFEKKKNSPGNVANGAVYIISKKLLKSLKNKDYIDFSTEVLPKLMGKIYTYKTPLPFIDIGTKKNFEKSQKI